MMEQELAEQATGCRATLADGGPLYDSEGCVFQSDEAAREALLNGESVEAPNAGAGSFRTILEGRLGLTELEVLDWTSSAGDWVFCTKSGSFFNVFQENRYPYHGFRYTADRRGD